MTTTFDPQAYIKEQYQPGFKSPKWEVYIELYVYATMTILVTHIIYIYIYIYLPISGT